MLIPAQPQPDVHVAADRGELDFRDRRHIDGKHVEKVAIRLRLDQQPVIAAAREDVVEGRDICRVIHDERVVIGAAKQQVPTRAEVKRVVAAPAIEAVGRPAVRTAPRLVVAGPEVHPLDPADAECRTAARARPCRQVDAPSDRRQAQVKQIRSRTADDRAAATIVALDEHVIPGTAVQTVIAGTAIQRVVVIATIELVIVGTTVEFIISIETVQRVVFLESVDRVVEIAAINEVGFEVAVEHWHGFPPGNGHF